MHISPSTARHIISLSHTKMSYIYENLTGQKQCLLRQPLITGTTKARLCFTKMHQTPSGASHPQSNPASYPRPPAPPVRLALVPPGGGVIAKKSPSPLFDLVAITAHRCSSFFAEAAVLVLVLALLDRFMLKGRIELDWVVSAFTISAALLVVSVLTEFSSRRWLQRH